MNLRQRGVRALAGVAVALVALAGTGCSTVSSILGTEDGNAQTQPGQPGRGMRFDTDALATALADGLGLDKAKVTTALDEAMASSGGVRTPGSGADGTPPADRGDGTRPSGRPSFTPPASAGAARPGLEQRLAAALADSLDVDEAKVLAIIQQQLGQDARRGSPAPTPAASA